MPTSKRNHSDGDFEPELFMSGLVCSGEGGEAAVEIHRGMIILTLEGYVVGTVAAVVNNKVSQQIKYILLSRLRQQLEYRVVPINLIHQVNDESVVLDILASLVNTLPLWPN